MISKEVKWFCRDYTQIENYNEAINDNTQVWDCHHKKEIEEGKTCKQLKQEGLYYNRLPQELIFLTHEEHSKLHSLNMMEEHKMKISKSLTGKSLKDEHKYKISESCKGHIPWNKGIKGYKHSKETKEKMSKSAEKRNTKEYRRKMSELLKRYYENKKMLNV